TSWPGTALPNASAALTWTAGAMATPATTLLGPTANARLAAAAGETVNAALVTVGSALRGAACWVRLTRFTLRPSKVATQEPLVGVAPPPVSVPVPTSASDTSWPGTALPNASAALTWTAGAMATPATTLLGPTANARLAAAAGETVNAALVTVGS